MISVKASLVSCVYVDHDGFFCFVFSDFFYSATLLYLDSLLFVICKK